MLEPVANLVVEQSKIGACAWIPYDVYVMENTKSSKGFHTCGQELFNSVLPASRIFLHQWNEYTTGMYIVLTNKYNNKPKGKAKSQKRDKSNITRTKQYAARRDAKLGPLFPTMWGDFRGVDYCADCGLQEDHCTCVYDFEPQSGLEISKDMSDTTTENITFHDDGSGYDITMDSVMDSTRIAGKPEELDLNRFLSRPIKIYSGQWATSTPLSVDFEPWDLFLRNPRVANRICNYHLLRGNLHLKFVINGNSFYYGRVMAMYHPLAAYDEATTMTTPTDLVQGSQMPKVFLNPTTSTGGTITCPFFYQLNSLRLNTDAALTMGTVYLRDLTELKHANGITGEVTISCFAWMDEVELDVLTSVDHYDLQPQAGEETDEANATGKISGPATAVARYASYFTKIPYIGPFAMATHEAASSTAAIAKLFGYSRPAVTVNNNPMKPVPHSSLAVTTTPDNSAKLTVDDKQELSIDPRIAGLGGEDPLTIKSIAKRESYLTSFQWITDAAPETLLWNCRVVPSLWATAGTPEYTRMTALGAACLPFQYWSGSLKFRFQIVCSGFHKGRLRVAYDPLFFQHSEYNVNSLRVVDISDENDFTVEIGNGQESTWLTKYDPGLTSTTQLYSTTNYSTNTIGNGVIALYVVNELTTPNPDVSADIWVNVFVSAGDDFEVAVPDNQFQNMVFKPQSGYEDEGDAPEQSQTYQLGPGKTDLSKTPPVFMGESIVSFRPLLKRYALHSTIGGASTSKVVYFGSRSSFPFLRGKIANAVHLTSGLVGYNYCNTLLVHIVTLGFAGWRGSMRWKIIPRGNSSTDATLSVENVSRLNLAHYSNRVRNLPTYANESSAAYDAVTISGTDKFADNEPRQLSAATGSLVQQTRLNKSVEFELPYQSENRFIPGKILDHTGNLSKAQLDVPSFRYRLESTIADASECFDTYHACGEDFQVYMWTGLPRLYFEAAPPAHE